MQNWDDTLWDDTLWLFTESEFNKLPDGFELTCIDDTTAIKGKDYVDMETWTGHIAYSINGPLGNHPEAQLLTTFMLSL